MSNEYLIIQIKFFSGEEVLCEVGIDDEILESHNIVGRVESFEIAADEQLIGCELDHGTNGFSNSDYFSGVTWLKWKIN